MMRLRDLNNSELIQRLDTWQGKEHSATLLVLKYLSEVDTRKLYLGLGYSSLFSFCTARLGYSEGSAQRRIVSARCIREYPEVYQALKTKQVTIVTIALFARVLTKSNVREVLNAVSNQRKDTVEAYVTGYSTVAAPVKEVIRAVVVRKPTELPLLAQPKGIAGLGQRGDLAPAPVPSVETELKFKLGFYVNSDTMEKLNRLKELKPYRSLEDLFDTLLSDYLKRNDPKLKASKADDSRPASRYVPSSVRALVLRRDDHRCSYVAPDGTRCSARHNLQIDHIVPFAIGGQTIESNLRTLCANHNRFEAKRVLGETVMGPFC